MSDREAFGDYVERLGLRYFPVVEVLDACRGGYPPASLHGNVGPTLLVLDAAREHMGRPIALTNLWRSVGYNASIGGKPRSQHLANTAADAVVIAGSWKEQAQRQLQELLTSWRGRRFYSPVRIERVDPGPIVGRPIPFEQLRIWDERYGPGSEFELRCGIGRYPTPEWRKLFTHLDTGRGDADW